jgi:hypothetical protein
MGIAEEAKTLPAWMQFQNEVAHLFQISSYDVAQDILVGFKKVDLMVSERRLGKAHRIAVECKDWSKSLLRKM